MKLALLALLVGGSARIAAAEGDVGDPLTMNSLTPVSTFNLDIGIPFWDTPDNVDLTTIGIELGGHFVDQKSGFGGYLAVPLSFVAMNIDLPIIADYDESEFSVGNVELGAMFAKWLGASKRVALVAHAGVALPTMSADNSEPLSNFVGALAPLAQAPRYTDLARRIDRSTWLRMGVSPMGREGKVFWRADLGLDVALDDDNADTLSPMFHINVGGGVDLGAASLQVELDTLITDADGDNTNSVLALGARFNGGSVRPGIAFLLPLGWDDIGGYDLNFALALSLTSRL